MITRQANYHDTEHHCPHCHEPIGVAEQVVHAPIAGDSEMSVWHYECFQRTLVGSVAHQLQSCRCYVAHSTCGDDPSLTPRQAARAATRHWLRQRQARPRRQIDLKHTPPECDRARKTELLHSVLHLVFRFYPHSFHPKQS